MAVPYLTARHRSVSIMSRPCSSWFCFSGNTKEPEHNLAGALEKVQHASDGKIKKKFWRSAAWRKTGLTQIPPRNFLGCASRPLCDFLIYYLLSFEDMRKEKKFLELCLSGWTMRTENYLFLKRFFFVACAVFFALLIMPANHKSFTWNALCWSKKNIFREKEKNYFVWKSHSIIFIHVVYMRWWVTRLLCRWDKQWWEEIMKVSEQSLIDEKL